MAYDTGTPLALATPQSAEEELHTRLLEITTTTSRALLVRKRGRPLLLSAPHLAPGLLLCMLRGWQSQLDLWRMIRFEGVGSLPCVPISDQAVYKHLAKVGQHAMHACFVQITLWLQQQCSPSVGLDLAPFARAVLALTMNR